MGALDGFEVMESVPEKTIRSAWNTREVIEAFLESGNGCMGKRCSDGHEAKKMYMAFHSFSKFNDLPVTVMKRGNMVIIAREDAE